MITPRTSDTWYRKILGDITIVTDSTRPDIYHHAANRISQHMQNSQPHRKQALKIFLRYPKGTETYELVFAPIRSKKSHPHRLQVYSDGDFANARNRKSITANFHTMNGTSVSWLSKNQSVVALSTTEAEYIAATTATQRTSSLQQLVISTHIPFREPTAHYIDNRSAVLIAENQAPTKRCKYIDIRHHYLQHHITEKEAPFTDVRLLRQRQKYYVTVTWR